MILNKIYNTEPGPGTYNSREVKTHQSSRRKELPPDFDPDTNRFTSEDFFELYEPGPGDYDPEKPEKHKMCMSFYNKPGKGAKIIIFFNEFTLYRDRKVTQYANKVGKICTE